MHLHLHLTQDICLRGEIAQAVQGLLLQLCLICASCVTMTFVLQVPLLQ